jgi:hypothetical protein
MNAINGNILGHEMHGNMADLVENMVMVFIMHFKRKENQWQYKLGGNKWHNVIFVENNLVLQMARGNK